MDSLGAAIYVNGLAAGAPAPPTMHPPRSCMGKLHPRAKSKKENAEGCCKTSKVERECGMLFAPGAKSLPYLRPTFEHPELSKLAPLPVSREELHRNPNGLTLNSKSRDSDELSKLMHRWCLAKRTPLRYLREERA